MITTKKDKQPDITEGIIIFLIEDFFPDLPKLVSLEFSEVVPIGGFTALEVSEDVSDVDDVTVVELLGVVVELLEVEVLEVSECDVVEVLEV